jgi:hypothetical protein
MAHVAHPLQEQGAGLSAIVCSSKFACKPGGGGVEDEPLQKRPYPMPTEIMQDLGVHIYFVPAFGLSWLYATTALLIVRERERRCFEYFQPRPEGHSEGEGFGASQV